MRPHHVDHAALHHDSFAVRVIDLDIGPILLVVVTERVDDDARHDNHHDRGNDIIVDDN